MIPLRQYYAVFLFLTIGLICIREVWSMRSLTQNEGNQNTNTDDIVRVSQGQKYRIADNGLNVKKQLVSPAENEDGDDGDDDEGEVVSEKNEGLRRTKGLHKAARGHNKKKAKHRGRRNRVKIHKSATQKRPADVVLLVDATGSMLPWFREGLNSVQNITKGLALEFLDNDHRNQIAIGQFEFTHHKIVLELGKWRASSINRAINQLKLIGQYEQDVSGAFTTALITAKNILINSPRKGNEDYDRIVILITDGMEQDRVNEAKIIREQLNVHIMFVIVGDHVESAKKYFYTDPDQKWETVKEMVSNPENDVIFDTTGS